MFLLQTTLCLFLHYVTQSNAQRDLAPQCLVVPSPGRCLDSEKRRFWSYSSKIGACAELYGCYGIRDRNVFQTLAVCERTCFNDQSSNWYLDCEVNPSPGLCLENEKRSVYTYSSKTSTCIQIDGCYSLRDKNVFLTQEGCRERCVLNRPELEAPPEIIPGLASPSVPLDPPVIIPAETQTSAQPADGGYSVAQECRINPSSGICLPSQRASFFTYSSKSSTCVQIYGCYSVRDRNVFLTRDSCRTNCLIRDTTDSTSSWQREPQCYVSPSPGRCRPAERQTLFSFSSKTNDCQQLFGCYSVRDRNVFRTLSSCRRHCVGEDRTVTVTESSLSIKIALECRINPSPGVCTDGRDNLFYSYSSKTGDCDEIYGCYSTRDRNVYRTRSECRRNCFLSDETSSSSQIMESQCNIVPSQGICREEEKMDFFTYSTKTNTCVRINGCYGLRDRNVFLTLRGCNQACSGGYALPLTTPSIDVGTVDIVPLPDSPDFSIAPECRINPSPGVCEESQQQRFYTFSSKTSSCVQINGCYTLRDRNVFASRNVCIRNCLISGQTTPSGITDPQCYLTPVAGRCPESEKRDFWSYSPKVSACIRIFGCYSIRDRNVFLQRSSCEKACTPGVTPPETSTLPPVPLANVSTECLINPSPGRCREQDRRSYFSYSMKTHRCTEIFGCYTLRDRNVFLTQENCQQECYAGDQQGVDKQCAVNPSPGNCAENQRRRYFSFSSKTNNCVQIFGCYSLHDRNVFASRAGCREHCESKFLDVRTSTDASSTVSNDINMVDIRNDRGGPIMVDLRNNQGASKMVDIRSDTTAPPMLDIRNNQAQDITNMVEILNSLDRGSFVDIRNNQRPSMIDMRNTNQATNMVDVRSVGRNNMVDVRKTGSRSDMVDVRRGGGLTMEDIRKGKTPAMVDVRNPVKPNLVDIRNIGSNSETMVDIRNPGDRGLGLNMVDIRAGTTDVNMVDIRDGQAGRNFVDVRSKLSGQTGLSTPGIVDIRNGQTGSNMVDIRGISDANTVDIRGQSKKGMVDIRDNRQGNTGLVDVRSELQSGGRLIDIRGTNESPEMIDNRGQSGATMVDIRNGKTSDNMIDIRGNRMVDIRNGINQQNMFDIRSGHAGSNMVDIRNGQTSSKMVDIRGGQTGTNMVDIRNDQTGSKMVDIRGGQTGTNMVDIRNDQTGSKMVDIRGGQTGTNMVDVRNGQTGSSMVDIRNGQIRQSMVDIRNGQTGQSMVDIRGGQTGSNLVDIRNGQTDSNMVDIRGGQTGLNMVDIRNGQTGQSMVDIRGGQTGLSMVDIRSGQTGQSMADIRDGQTGSNMVDIRNGQTGQSMADIRGGQMGSNMVDIRSDQGGQNMVDVRNNVTGLDLNNMVDIRGNSMIDIRNGQTGSNMVDIRNGQSGTNMVDVRNSQGNKMVDVRQSGRRMTDMRSVEGDVNMVDIRGSNSGMVDIRRSQTNPSMVDVRGPQESLNMIDIRDRQAGMTDVRDPAGTTLVDIRKAFTTSDIQDTGNNGANFVDIRSGQGGANTVDIRGQNVANMVDIRRQNGANMVDIREQRGANMHDIRGQQNGNMVDIRNGQSAANMVDIRGQENANMVDIRGQKNGKMIDIRGGASMVDIRGQQNGNMVDIRGQQNGNMVDIRNGQSAANMVDIRGQQNGNMVDIRNDPSATNMVDIREQQIGNMVDVRRQQSGNMVDIRNGQNSANMVDIRGQQNGNVVDLRNDPSATNMVDIREQQISNMVDIHRQQSGKMVDIRNGQSSANMVDITGQQNGNMVDLRNDPSATNMVDIREQQIGNMVDIRGQKNENMVDIRGQQNGNMVDIRNGQSAANIVDIRGQQNGNMVDIRNDPSATNMVDIREQQNRNMVDIRGQQNGNMVDIRGQQTGNMVDIRNDQTTASMVDIRGQQNGNMVDIRGQKNENMVDVRGQLKGNMVDIRNNQSAANIRGQQTGNMVDIRGQKTGNMVDIQNDQSAAGMVDIRGQQNGNMVDIRGQRNMVDIRGQQQGNMVDIRNDQGATNMIDIRGQQNGNMVDIRGQQNGNMVDIRNNANMVDIRGQQNRNMVDIRNQESATNMVDIRKKQGGNMVGIRAGQSSTSMVDVRSGESNATVVDTRPLLGPEDIHSLTELPIIMAESGLRIARECLINPTPGFCLENQRKQFWTFSTKTNSCTKIIGCFDIHDRNTWLSADGCRKNCFKNDSAIDTSDALPLECQLNPTPGRCLPSEEHVVWVYNTKLAACTQIKGCYDYHDRNVWSSLDRCRVKCKVTVNIIAPEIPSNVDDLRVHPECHINPSPGSCVESQMRTLWTFSSKTSACTRITGCYTLRDRNTWRSRDECMDNCIVNATDVTLAKPLECRLIPSPGRCLDSQKNSVYTYSEKLGICVEITGCYDFHDRNVWRTVQACNDRCHVNSSAIPDLSNYDIALECQLNPSPGRCQESEKRSFYSFSDKAGGCVEIYGCYTINDRNVWYTSDGCRNSCLIPKGGVAPDVPGNCTLAPRQRICFPGEQMYWYHYNTTSRSCERIYGCYQQQLNNVFPDSTLCKTSCLGYRLPDHTIDGVSRECRLNPTPGVCRQDDQRTFWSYSQKTGTCVEITGCYSMRDRNVWFSRDMCMNNCRKQEIEPRSHVIPNFLTSNNDNTVVDQSIDVRRGRRGRLLTRNMNPAIEPGPTFQTRDNLGRDVIVNDIFVTKVDTFDVAVNSPSGGLTTPNTGGVSNAGGRNNLNRISTSSPILSSLNQGDVQGSATGSLPASRVLQSLFMLNNIE